MGRVDAYATLCEFGVDRAHISAPGAGAGLDEVVVEDVPECREAIHRADLFPFFVGAAVVGDRHLVGPRVSLADHRGDFDFHAEALARQGHRLDDFGAEGFITRFNIGHVAVSQHVREEGQADVGEVVVEVQHARGLAH